MSVYEFDRNKATKVVGARWHETANECHEWEGPRHTNGTPRVTINGRMHDARRVRLYGLTGTCLPKGMYLLPLCNNHGCMNDTHIRVHGDIESLATFQAKALEGP